MFCMHAPIHNCESKEAWVVTTKIARVILAVTNFKDSQVRGEILTSSAY